MCVCMSASHLCLFLPMCHTIVRLFSYLAVMVAPMSKHTYTHIPDTQSNISVNETGGPLLHRVLTALSVSVTAGEERARKHRINKIEKGEKGERMEAEKKGRAEEWWILLIAIVIPPCRKWLPPLSH